MVDNLYRRFGALGGRVAGLQTAEEINTSRSNRRNVDAATDKARVDTQRAMHDLRIATRFDASDRAAALQGQITTNRHNAKIADILEKYGDDEAASKIDLTRSQASNQRASTRNLDAATKEIPANSASSRALQRAQAAAQIAGARNTDALTGEVAANAASARALQAAQSEQALANAENTRASTVEIPANAASNRALNQANIDNLGATAENTRAGTKEIPANAVVNRGLLRAQTSESKARAGSTKQDIMDKQRKRKEELRLEEARIAAANAASAREQAESELSEMNIQRMKMTAAMYGEELSDIEALEIEARAQKARNSLTTEQLLSVSGILQSIEPGNEDSYMDAIGAMGPEVAANLNLPLEYIEGISEQAVKAVNSQLINTHEGRRAHETMLTDLEEAIMRTEAAMNPRERSVYKWWKSLEDQMTSGSPEQQEWARNQMNRYIELQTKTRLTPEQIATAQKTGQQLIFNTLFTGLMDGLNNGTIENQVFTSEDLSVARQMLDGGITEAPSGAVAQAYKTLQWMLGKAAGISINSLADSGGDVERALATASAWADSPFGGGALISGTRVDTGIWDFTLDYNDLNLHSPSPPTNNRQDTTLDPAVNNLLNSIVGQPQN